MHKITGGKNSSMHYTFNSVSESITQESVASWCSLPKHDTAVLPAWKFTLKADTDIFAHAYTGTQTLFIEEKYTEHKINHLNEQFSGI